MRLRTSVWSAVIVAVICASSAAQELRTARVERQPAEFQPADLTVPDEIAVVFDEAATTRADARGDLTPWLGDVGLDNLAQQIGVDRVRKQFAGATAERARQSGLPDLSGYHVVRFDATLSTPEAAVAAYRATPGVKHAETIGIHPLYAVPNDGNYPSQWHLNQASDKDIDAPEAWDIETGAPTAIVAVLDTGVRYYHKDLGGSAASASNPTAADGNMWINLAEKNGVAGMDDDGNGFVDDWVGYDFVTGVTGCSTGEDCSTADNDPRDFNGHGTHCAGNVSAINNNGYATCSPAGGWGNGTQQPTANGVKVMATRIGWATPGGGFVRMDFAASALYYAANNGARIATCSWGSSNSGGIAAAIDNFLAAGGVIFKAAGNANNQTADYMCARSDIYCVAATNESDARASFSSYGAWVNISAPGNNILSSYHNSADPTPDYIATISGTSMATPLTASVAAAVWSQNPTWTAAQVWARVRDTADNIDAQNPSFIGLLGSGRVNLFNAVNTGAPPGCQNNAECSDGNACNGVETCVAGVCQPGTITDCNANGVDDSCDVLPGGGSADCNTNGVPDECEGGDPCAGTHPTLLLVFGGTTSIPGVGNVANEDIVAYDTVTGGFSLYFDGSDVGLGGNSVDAVARLANGDLLISTGADGNLAGLTGGPNGIAIDDSDLVRFTPTSLGATTAGTWTFYFDGSDVGLTTSNEDIDALAVLPDGRLLISTLGSPSVAGLSGLVDEDLIQFTPTSLGSVTAGTWAYYFDGSDVGLSDGGSSENVEAAALSGANLLLSTAGSFAVPGLSGPDEDVFQFAPTSLGTVTAGTYSASFDATAAGISSAADVVALEFIP